MGTKELLAEEIIQELEDLQHTTVGIKEAILLANKILNNAKILARLTLADKEEEEKEKKYYV